jgi:hypothetical protein
MRSTLAILCVLGVAPLAAQDEAPVVRGTTDVVQYVPVRTGQSYSAGFLSEMRLLPYGELLGAVTPSQVPLNADGRLIGPGVLVGVLPPAGASYAAGDTVVIVEHHLGPKGWGDVVIPKGLAVIRETQETQTLATILALYGTIRNGQQILPLEKVVNPGSVQPVKGDGLSSLMIASRDPRVLLQPGNIIFIDAGRTAGMRLGDFVEVRRLPGPRINGADTVDQLMATGQVVVVNEKHSSVILTQIVSPDIPSGTPVVRVATLPN